MLAINTSKTTIFRLPQIESLGNNDVLFQHDVGTNAEKENKNINLLVNGNPLEGTTLKNDLNLLPCKYAFMVLCSSTSENSTR